MGRKSREKRERREREHSASKWGNFTPYGPPVRNFRPQPTPSSGSTDSERLLARLARRTFLSPFSFPNVFRAERRKHDTISMEVCDLLVVFGNDVLIFSDKECTFPEGATLDVRWGRWYRRAVEKSASQLHGAERVLRAGVPLFLDPELKVPFPLRLPGPADMRVHRILVANGASEQCRRELGGSGSLLIRPSLTGDDHVKASADGGMPFAVGRVNDTQPFVHILDDTSLPLLLQNLDTAPDFINYLSKKARFIASRRLALAAGEEALLGQYLGALGSDGEHDFVFSGTNAVTVNESRWLGYLRSRERAAKLKADRVSYLWDEYVERFAHHFREGTAEHLTHRDPAEHALILRFFAGENRTKRRGLAESLIEMIRTTPAHGRRLRVLPPMRPGEPYWVLFLCPHLRSASPEKNREVRRHFLEASAMVTKLMFPDALDIACFATESGNGTTRTEDAMYLNARTWTPEMEAQAKDFQARYGLLTTHKPIHMHVDEYPV